LGLVARFFYRNPNFKAKKKCCEWRQPVGSYAPIGDARMTNKRASYTIRFIKQGDENERLQNLIEMKVHEVLLNTQFTLIATESHLFKHFLVARGKGDEHIGQ
jgi:hypothetical protein